MKKYSPIFAICIFVVFLVLQSLLHIENKKILKYLDDYSSPLTLGHYHDYNGLSLLKNDLIQSQIFLSGEYHGTQLNNDVRLKLLTYLHQNSEQLIYLAEWPYSFTELVNIYLDTGNESIINHLFSFLEGTFLYSNEDYEFIKKVYDYNQAYTLENQIRFKGIDIEYDYIAFFYLSSLVSQHPHQEFGPIILRLTQYAKQQSKRSFSEEEIRFIDELYQDLQDNRDIYENKLGEDYFSYSFTLSNLYHGTQLYYEYYEKDQKKFFIQREKKKYRNFKALFNLNQFANYYGQFGSVHIHQQKYRDYEFSKDDYRLAHMINEYPPLKNKVTSIVITYEDSFVLDVTGKNEKGFSFKTNYNQKHFTTINKDHTAVMYKLNGNNSPFDKKRLILKNGDSVTTDYFQYVIHLRNSQATTLFQKNSELPSNINWSDIR
ncbi:hypothetical protein [Bacillus alkalicellulosilyticus]|uniref:hypothetical protein n=1 Tax=Alkalihalobacterium alkalicellulosilyticum TaxID=1912214 RepID=UPI000997392C|nr:hypothetical protein [Bacillus alkalicellulosilyticus]